MKNKKTKSPNRKSLFFSALSFIVSLVMIVGAVYAWYTVSFKPQTGRWSTAVITDPNDKYKDVIKISNYGENDETMLSPGMLLNYKITLKNVTEQNCEFKLNFEKIVVVPPIFHSDVDYSKYICDIYEVDGTSHLPYDPLEDGADAAALLRSFATPVSNAVSFYYGLEEKLYSDLVDEDAKIKTGTMKALDDLLCDPSDPAYKRFVGGSRKTVCENIGLFEYPPEEFEPEWIEVPANDEVDVYFSLYFDPFIIAGCTFNDKELIMKNSNGFLRQELRVTFGLEIR